jgi:hypothetical protein
MGNIETVLSEVLLLYSGPLLLLLGQCGMDLQLHQSNYLAQLVTNGILDSSQEIDQRVQTS